MDLLQLSGEVQLIKKYANNKRAVLIIVLIVVLLGCIIWIRNKKASFEEEIRYMSSVSTDLKVGSTGLITSENEYAEFIQKNNIICAKYFNRGKNYTYDKTCSIYGGELDSSLDFNSSDYLYFVIDNSDCTSTMKSIKKVKINKSTARIIVKTVNECPHDDIVRTYLPVGKAIYYIPIKKGINISNVELLVK